MSSVEPSDADAGGETEDKASDEGTKPDDTSERDPDAEPLLVIDNLRKSFGGLVAVDGASFSVDRGSITGLVGPNGAGKSTTFNCVTGMLGVDDGRVEFADEEITNLRPHEVANRGLVRTFQTARELSEMTVLENMMLAPRGQRDEVVLPALLPTFNEEMYERERAILDDAWETLEFFEIDHLAHEYAQNLSGGQRKLLELARALMTEPDMLLLDEPFAGVNPSLEEQLLDRVHELRESGYTFLVVEHDMDLIMENCERVIVMHQGDVLAEGKPDVIRSDERVIEAYLGGTA